MSDPKFQAVWHDLNQSQVALVLAEGEADPSKRRTLLAEAQLHAKQADVLLKQMLAGRLSAA